MKALLESQKSAKKEEIETIKIRDEKHNNYILIPFSL